MSCTVAMHGNHLWNRTLLNCAGACGCKDLGATWSHARVCVCSCGMRRCVGAHPPALHGVAAPIRMVETEDHVTCWRVVVGSGVDVVYIVSRHALLWDGNACW